MSNRRTVALLICFVGAQLAPSAPALGSDPQNGNAGAEAVVKASVADLFAKREAQFKAGFAPGATIVSSSGSLRTVDQFFADGKPDANEREWFTMTDPKTVTYGDVAVSTFTVGDHERWPSRAENTNYITGATLIRQNDRWLIAALQITALRPDRTSVAIAVLQRYAGFYKSGTGDWFKVALSGNKLFSRTTGDTHPYEMVPASATTFYAEGDPSEYIFVDDASGAVRALVQVQGFHVVTYHKVK